LSNFIFCLPFVVSSGGISAACRIGSYSAAGALSLRTNFAKFAINIFINIHFSGSYLYDVFFFVMRLVLVYRLRLVVGAQSVGSYTGYNVDLLDLVNRAVLCFKFLPDPIRAAVFFGVCFQVV